MSTISSKLHPTDIKYLYWAVLEQRKYKIYASITEAVKYLVDEAQYDSATAKEQIELAIQAKVLQEGKVQTAGRVIKTISVPNLSSIQSNNTHDLYCYECHQAENLQNCKNCLRAFHKMCVRKNPDYPILKETKIVSNKHHLKQPDSNDESDNEVEHDDDSASNDSESIIAKKDLCTCCRILRLSAKRDPKDKTQDETNNVLKFVLERVKSWTTICTVDTFFPKEKDVWSIPMKYFENFQKLVFKNPISLEKMSYKIEINAYKNISEFQCDLFDLRHCFGLIYTTDEHHYENYILALKDAIYDLSEIRKCLDCFKFSNQRESDKDWFCRPCNPMHDLVFAKCESYPYWPGKVIKVFKNGQYDIRFFSKKNERQILSKDCIKPVNEKTLEDIMKVAKKNSGLAFSLKELKKYQEYAQQLAIKPSANSYPDYFTTPLTSKQEIPIVNILPKKKQTLNKKVKERGQALNGIWEAISEHLITSDEDNDNVIIVEERQQASNNNFNKLQRKRKLNESIELTPIGPCRAELTEFTPASDPGQTESTRLSAAIEPLTLENRKANEIVYSNIDTSLRRINTKLSGVPDSKLRNLLPSIIRDELKAVESYYEKKISLILTSPQNFGYLNGQNDNGQKLNEISPNKKQSQKKCLVCRKPAVYNSEEGYCSLYCYKISMNHH